jgi:ubiquinone/menaquinone biosynthesis C-methylase UbiE
MTSPTRGFGTNFHNVYKSNAEKYHAFSAAEHLSPDLLEVLRNLLVPGILLDVACGTCHKSNLFSKYFEKVFALDYSDALLTFARDKYGRNQKLNFLLSTASNIPLLDQSINTIMVTWGSFPLSKTIREMKRVLRQEGVILRIGVLEKDEFTSLFPSFDIKRINRINRTFKSQGFTIEPHDITIRFKSIPEAKEILSNIIGVSSKRINQSTFKHKVAFCYYKKT